MKTKKTQQELEKLKKEYNRLGITMMIVTIVLLLVFGLAIDKLQDTKLKLSECQDEINLTEGLFHYISFDCCQKHVPYEVSTHMISIVGSNVKVYIDSDLRSANPSKNGTINFWIDTCEEIK